MAPRLGALAEEFLAERRRDVDDPDRTDHSHEARVDDLVRFAHAFCRTVTDDDRTAAGVADAFGALTADTLTADAVAETARELRRPSPAGVRYAPATVKRTMSTVRTWTRWAARRGYLDHDPCDDDRVEAVTRTSPAGDAVDPVQAFSDADVTAMRAAALAPTSSPRAAWPARDLAVLDVLAGCGVRASELCALEIRHVDRRHGVPQLRVRKGAKGDRPRDVPIPRRTIAAVDAYLDERAGRLGRPAPHAPLFVRVDARPFDRSFLDRLVRRVAADAGVTVPDDAAAHGLRHYLGVQLALRSVPVPVIQQVLGHADPRTTAIYTQMANDLLSSQLADAGWL